MMALRSATQESTKSTPAMLQLGRELHLPVDLLLSCPEEHLPVHSYNEKLQKTLETVHEYAREKLQLSSESMKTYYNLRSDDTTFEQGDIVWLYNPWRVPGIGPKFMRPWEGPYVVTKAINDLVYRIQLTQRSRPKVVHRNCLWTYNGSNPPTWYRTSQSPSHPNPWLINFLRTRSSWEGDSVATTDWPCVCVVCLVIMWPCVLCVCIYTCTMSLSPPQCLDSCLPDASCDPSLTSLHLYINTHLWFTRSFFVLSLSLSIWDLQ